MIRTCDLLATSSLCTACKMLKAQQLWKCLHQAGQNIGLVQWTAANVLLLFVAQVLLCFHHTPRSPQTVPNSTVPAEVSVKKKKKCLHGDFKNCVVIPWKGSRVISLCADADRCPVLSAFYHSLDLPTHKAPLGRSRRHKVRNRMNWNPPVSMCFQLMFEGGALLMFIGVSENSSWY